MTTEAIKSASVTNLDASPIVLPQAGMGGQGYLMNASDYVTTTAGVTTGSTYKIVRLPTNAKVKKVLLTCAAHGGSAAFDFSVAHSDSTTDGTPAALQGNIVQISSADNKLFGAGLSLVSALTNSDKTFAGTFTSQYANMELWNVLVTLGATTFSADPGGFFDIVAKSTATDASGGNIGLSIDYVV